MSPINSSSSVHYMRFVTFFPHFSSLDSHDTCTHRWVSDSEDKVNSLPSFSLYVIMIACK